MIGFISKLHTFPGRVTNVLAKSIGESEGEYCKMLILFYNSCYFSLTGTCSPDLDKIITCFDCPKCFSTAQRIPFLLLFLN